MKYFLSERKCLGPGVPFLNLERESNILELFNILPIFSFSETERDHQ